MEPIQQQLNAKCIKENKAFGACAQADCKSPSLMCQNKVCQCIKLHSKCEVEVLLSKLQAKFQSKHLNTKSLLYQIYTWYENQSKLIAVEMESLQRIIDSQQFKLSGEEEKLYSCLVEGKSDQVVPQLVANVYKTLYKTDDKNLEAQTKSVRSQLEKEEKALKKTIDNIRDLITKNITQSNSSFVPQFKFSRSLHYSGISLVDDQTIKKMNSSVYGGAVLEPSLLAKNFQYSSCKATFKIVNAPNSEFIFGVCQLTPNFSITSSTVYNVIEYGALAYYTCCSYVGNKGNHKKQATNISHYQTNDQVSIQYWKQTQKVEVRNITKNTQSVSFISTDKNLPLYFTILLYAQDSQVKLLQVEYK